VEDTGKGIAAKDLPHIFDRFYKADSARSSQVSGSGLGLAIVKQIVLQHNGTIEIVSKLAEGTMITIKFPRAIY
jgi:signal transduction histidine kinase